MNVVIDDLLPKHPLIYDSYNLCELASKGKFTTFAVSVLREMCCSFGIDVEDIHGKRRKAYPERLQSLCDAAHASNNWAVFYAGRSDCEGWVRVTKMSQTPFWGVNLPLQNID